VVREELEGHDFKDGAEELGRGRDVDDVVHELHDVFIPLGGDGDDAAGACGDLLDVGEGFFVALDAGGVREVAGGDADDGEGLVDEGVGAVLHLAGGVAFGVDVGDLLELECAFEGDGVVDAAAEEEEVAGVGEDAGEFFAVGDEGEARAGAAVGVFKRQIRGSFDFGRYATFAQDDGIFVGAARLAQDDTAIF